MKNDADYEVRNLRGGKFNSLPSSFRTISNYLRSVSANASSIAASTVRQAAVTAASSGVFNHEGDRQREQVQWSNFDKLELDSGEIRQVLLLTYLNGFQLWDVQDARNVHELVSRRDGPVAFLRLQPRPIPQKSIDGGANFKGARPLLLVITSDSTGSGSLGAGGFSGGYGAGSGGASLAPVAPHFVPNLVRFYSLRNHSYVHSLRFPREIHAVRCSSRVVAVAVATQIYCYDAGTLQNIFSVVTYPSPAPSPGSSHYGFGAMAVGPRWLAYATNQPLVLTTGRVSPQHLSPSPGVSPSTSPANGGLVAHYAKESSKHIVAGVVSFSEMSYKKFAMVLQDGGNGSPGSGSPNWKNGTNGHSPWPGGSTLEPEFAGTVSIRDIVSKSVVAQFRAHSSPLSALAFDPSGTLLVTASVYGHNLNVFRLTPPSSIAGGNVTGGDTNTTYVHLYKLSRGVTNAVIQDISFSCDSYWIVVSSSRGTSHLFAISPFGGMVGPHTHGTVPIDGLIGPTLTSSPVFPWWSRTRPVSLNQQALYPPPPAITLNVVSRIKNGNGGWRGTVTSAAVTATGRPNVLAGAVAAVFHDGGGVGVESDIGVGTLKDQLWVMCPTGHLLRYLLRPSVGGDSGYTNGLPQMAGMGAAGSPALPQELKVVVEPVERWDVARRPNWVEREEGIEAQIPRHEEAGVGSVASPGGTGVFLGTVVKEGMTTEEMQRLFMSNAEVQMHQARPVPIWAKSKIQFHVMLSRTVKELESEDYLCGDELGETEIERIPTRVVEVRRRDLVPVIERLQKYTKVPGARDIVIPDTLPGASKSHDELLVDEGLQDRFMAGGLEIMPLKRTSSCSSFGSGGAPFGASGGGMNGYHRGYQDLPDVVTADTPSSTFGSPPYFHQTQQGLEPSVTGRTAMSHGRLLQSKAGGSELYQADFNPVNITAEQGGVVIGSPINIPWAEQREVGTLAGYNKPGVSASGKSVNASHGGSVDGELSDPLDRQVDQLGATPANGDSMSVANRQFDNLALQENGGMQLMRSGASMNRQNRWKMAPTSLVVVNGSCPHGMQSADSPTMTSALNPEFGAAFLIDHSSNPPRRGVATDGPLNGSSAHGDMSGTADDVASEDTEGARSKSENENAEQADDVWESSMFPFCEEDC